MTEITTVNNNQLDATPANRINSIVSSQAIQDMLLKSLGQSAGAFTTSLIELYSDPAGTLQHCNAKNVALEALKAASLKLPINNNLGFAYIVPYKNGKTGQYNPQFILGYKGYIQLAMRSGQYLTINSDIVYQGMSVETDYLTGAVRIAGVKMSDEAIGYFAYFKLKNGFEKTIYWTKERLEEHARKNSPGFKYKDKYGNVWNTNYNEMALKTVTRRLLSKYGVLSTEMQTAIMEDADNRFTEKIEAEAGKIEFKEQESLPNVDQETGEIKAETELTAEQQAILNSAPF